MNLAIPDGISLEKEALQENLWVEIQHNRADQCS